jgi:alkyl hydroperoxide reductase subunit F
MLDLSLKEQLISAFLNLETEIILKHRESDHPDQGSLLEMLTEVASCSSKLKVQSSGQNSKLPHFFIQKGNSESGISFTGVPGGHEFTSLIVAILNIDGKGKLPDPQISKRIRLLKGPIRLKTYVSLSCENCPDVVQALNQMALIHSDFKNETIDGANTQDEIKRLGIQGVPSILTGDTLIHSGRISFIDLLNKLEEKFGSEKASVSENEEDLGQFDVVVVGGGPAGASAAIYSARKGQKTALIAEKLGGQVQDTKGIENMISIPYTEGPTLVAEISKHLTQYPIQILENRRVKNITQGKPSLIKLESGEKLSAQSVIIASGAKWRELGIPGEKEYLGRGVAFCPHCDGPFYKGKKVAVIGGGNSGAEAAIDLSGIAREVVLFEYNDQLKADQVLIDKLRKTPNASIVTSAKTKTILGDDKKVTSLVYEDLKSKQDITLDLDGIFVQIGLLPNSQFLKGTLELTRFGEVVVDEKGRTSVPGIYAAGDVTTTPYKQIIIAMGDGAKTALAAFEDRMRS